MIKFILLGVSLQTTFPPSLSLEVMLGINEFHLTHSNEGLSNQGNCR